MIIVLYPWIPKYLIFSVTLDIAENDVLNHCHVICRNFYIQHTVKCCHWEWWHFYSCSSLRGKSPLKNASNPAATRVSITVLTPLSPATSKRRVCAPRVLTGQSVSATQVAMDGNMELFIIIIIYFCIKLFIHFSDSPKPKKRNRKGTWFPCNCER